MRKVLLLIIWMAAVGLGGCQNKNADIEEIVVEKAGQISAKIGDEFLLSTDKEIVNMASKKIDLEKYLKKKVIVRGMFSGSTLYVDELKEE